MKPQTHSFSNTVEEPKKLQRLESENSDDGDDDEEDEGAARIVVHTHSFSNTHSGRDRKRRY